MANVKGSTQYRMVVMPYRPMRRVFNVALVIILLLIAGFASFFYGYDQGLNQRLGMGQGSQDARPSREESESLRQEVANLKLASQVDRQAHEDMRRQALEQKTRIADLERDISVYRGMVSKSASNNPQGVTIGSFQISGPGGVRGYKYKLVVQQLAASEDGFTGTLALKILGSRGEEKIAVPLHQVSNQVSDELIPLDFKYFQSLEGELLLPESFAPERIEVTIKSAGRQSTPTHLEQQLDWPSTGL